MGVSENGLDLIARLETRIEQLRNQTRGSPNSVKVALSTSLAHAEIILRTRLETNDLMENLLALPTRQQSMELAATYAMAYERTVQSENVYRLGLYVLFTVLIIAIAISILSKLRAAITAS